MAETNSAFRRDLQEMGALLTGAFGPQGRAAMITNQTGQSTITRGGLDILQAVYSGDRTPSERILLGSVERLHERCADGVKSLIFATEAMLGRCEGMDASPRILRQFGELHFRLSQLQTNAERIEETETNPDGCTNAKIFETFLGTRFPPLVSSFLAALLHEWVSKLSLCVCNVDKRDKTRNVSSLVEDFSVLCRYDTGSRSISDSRVREGFLIGRGGVNLFRSGLRKVVIAKFEDAESSGGKFEDLDVACEVGRLLNDIRAYKKDGCGDFLVLTPAVLPQASIFSLKRENVAIIHCAPLEEVDYLSRALAPIRERLSEDFAYHPMDVVFESGKDYTFLNVPLLWNVFICGPTSELRAGYARACKSALRLLAESGTVVSSLDRVVPGGGEFERNLHRSVYERFGLSSVAVPALGGRAELLRWQAEKLSTRPPLNATYETISAAFSGLDRDVMETVLAGVTSIPRKLPDGPTTSQITEPVALKLSILQSALASVITIIKIDGTVYTKKVPKNVLTK